MAEIALNTSYAEENQMANGKSRQVIEDAWAANTSAALKYHTATVSGTFVRARVNASVTSDATKTYTFIITNVTKSKTVTAAGQLYDASPVLTAGTVADLTLSSTAADIAVDEGDILTFSMAGGTGSGLAGIEVVIESD